MNVCDVAIYAKYKCRNGEALKWVERSMMLSWHGMSAQQTISFSSTHIAKSLIDVTCAARGTSSSDCQALHVVTGTCVLACQQSLSVPHDAEQGVWHM